MNPLLRLKIKIKSIENDVAERLGEQRKKKVQSLVRSVTGYDLRDWARQVVYEECFKLLQTIEPEKLNVLEISAGQKFQALPFKSFRELYFPEFDVCKDTLPERFDLIIADQVWEHLAWPYRAAKNVHEMLAPGGYFLNTTPFLIRVHEMPLDCTRWTESGMKYFLAEAGFPLEKIVTASWGNRACVKANLRTFPGWARRGWFGSLKNERSYPVQVWALAQKGTGAEDALATEITARRCWGAIGARDHRDFKSATISKALSRATPGHPGKRGRRASAAVNGLRASSGKVRCPGPRRGPPRVPRCGYCQPVERTPRDIAPRLVGSSRIVPARPGGSVSRATPNAGAEGDRCECNS